MTDDVRAVERIELVDELFYRATGMPAPGRSYAAAMGEPYTLEERRERYQRWWAEDAWRQLCEHAVRLQRRLDALEEEK